MSSNPDGPKPAAFRKRFHASFSHSLPSEMRLTARLGTPLALGELGWMSTYIVDAIMIGRMPHSALSISASSLGNSIFSALVFCAIGLVFGLDTLVSQAWGHGDREDALHSLVQGVWLMATAAPVVIGLTLLAPPMLRLLHVDPVLVAETARFVRALVWSTLPLMFYFAVRQYLQALDRPGWVMVSLLTANVVNWAGDAALIYGEWGPLTPLARHWGWHGLGIAGSGWATVATRVYMLGLLLVSLAISLRQAPVKLRPGWWQPRPRRVRALVQLGWPVGLQKLGDLSIATFATVLTSQLGTTMLAAHQVVLDLNAFAAMVPLGFSEASAVRTGQAVGHEDPAQTRRAGVASWVIIGGVMAVASLLFVFAPGWLARVYTTDHAVVAAAVPIFLICAFNQLLDGSQVVLTGALRGMGETRVPFLANFGCSWLWGVPISALLVWRLHMGLVGVWLGETFAVVPIFLIVLVTWLRRVRTTQSGLRRRRQEGRVRAPDAALEGFSVPLPAPSR